MPAWYVLFNLCFMERSCSVIICVSATSPSRVAMRWLVRISLSFCYTLRLPWPQLTTVSKTTDDLEWKCCLFLIKGRDRSTRIKQNTLISYKKIIITRHITILSELSISRKYFKERFQVIWLNFQFSDQSMLNSSIQRWWQETRPILIFLTILNSQPMIELCK